MAIIDSDFHARPALPADQRSISELMRISPYVHRHLDWRYALDWIGIPPFYVLEYRRQIVAALACPPDPPGVAWLRLFVSSGAFLEQSWQLLWGAVRPELVKEHCIAAVIILHDWISNLLRASSFVSRQSIVMLESDGRLPPGMVLPGGVTIRSMAPSDLPVVAEVDASAFDLLWQNSLQALEQAYPQAALATVAEVGRQVIGYQISTRNALGMHLARLAVRPAAQGSGVGRALVIDLLNKAAQRGFSHLTVNTQSDNAASLAVYKKTGFHETGERYPVYQLQIS